MQMMTSPRISLIIIQYGNTELLWNLLISLERHADRELVSEVIVVNNGLALGEECRAKLEAYKVLTIRVVDNSKKSYASGVNLGVAAAKGNMLIIANNDIEWIPNSSIRMLIDHFQQDPLICIVGPQLIYPNGNWQRSYGRFSSLREAIISLAMFDSIWHGVLIAAFRYNWWFARKARAVDYVDGAFMVIKRHCFEEIGGFDESYTFYGEEMDFCWRAWKCGRKVVFIPNVKVMHIRGASSTTDALADYTIRLINAKQKFVKKNFGQRRARLYGCLVQMALFERYLLYSFIAKLIRSPNWQQRAFQAHARFQAVKGVGLC